MMPLVKKYILHPLRLLFANASVFVVFFAAIVANFFSSNEKVPLDNTGEWAFRILPTKVISFATEPTVIALLVLAFVGKCLLTLVVAKEMLLIYQHARRGIVNSIRRLRVNELFWYFGCQLITYLLFGAIAMGLYLPGYFLYNSQALDVSLILLAIFAILYPAFYIVLSTGSMMAVLPVDSHARWQKLRFLLFGRRFLVLYAFYFVRISLELGLLFIVPFAALALFRSWWIALVSSAIGLVLPFALMRGSAYELKLTLLREDQQIRDLFPLHYKELEQLS